MKKLPMQICSLLLFLCFAFPRSTETTAHATETQKTMPSYSTALLQDAPSNEGPLERVRSLAEATASKSGIDNEWALFIVSKEQPLPEGYKPKLEALSCGQHLDIRCSKYAAALLEAAEADGVKLDVISAYRSMETQKLNFDRLYCYYLEEGYTKDSAYWITASVIMPPGQSEHNAGVCLDLLSPDWFEHHENITNEFSTTKQFEWLAGNAWKYGFVLRYPKDKHEITGVIYESWHYRFVGLYHASKIHNSGLTLEEYIGKYERAA